VAVYTDPRSAAVLTGLPGLQLDASVVEAVLTAADRSPPASRPPSTRRWHWRLTVCTDN
jgi:hypothetical protein